MTRWWLSFADDDGFRGAVCLYAPTPMLAHLQACARGLNPGGEVLILPMLDTEDLDVPEGVLMSAEFIESRGLGGKKPDAMGSDWIDRTSAEIVAQNSRNRGKA